MWDKPDVKFVSTRGGDCAPVEFATALRQGLAADGGLFTPESLPRLTHKEIAAFAGQPYETVAERILGLFIGDAFSATDLRQMMCRAHAGFAHAARAPLRQMATGHFLLELFHGPTFAFKDFAMQIIGQMLRHDLQSRDARATVLGATSGDTGAAAIEAFRGQDNIETFVLFPRGRISDMQRRQMTTPDDANVHAIAVKGTFDDCQARVKELFADRTFSARMHLTGVNSINLARVVAQTCYYFAAAVALGAPHRQVDFTVPTGNFGNVLAGHWARRMGLPVRRLVIATNQNDILYRCLASAEYAIEKVLPSLSPSMDIQVASNFERTLFEVLDRNGAEVARLMGNLARDGAFTLEEGTRERLAQAFLAVRVSEQETVVAMRDAWQASGTMLCPHSAVGYHAALARQSTDVPMITLATAHPAKFPAAVEQATGAKPELPPQLERLSALPERFLSVKNDAGAIRGLIEERVAG